MKHPTLLAQYLADRGMTQAEFGRKVAIHRSILTRYVTGARRPGLEYALAIETATGGAVPASYWADFTPRRKRKPQAA